jgi:glycosyltransferase involved in cell wall biosynthesis
VTASTVQAAHGREGDSAAVAQRRVLHCLWDGGIGGTQRAVYQLVREQLRDPALAPAVLFAKGVGPYWERTKGLGCPTVVLDLPHGRALGHLPLIARRLRPFAIHHFHSAEPLLMLASALSGSACRVYTHRGGTIDYPPKKKLQYGLVGLLLRRSFHGLSGNTRWAAGCAAELFHLPAERFQVTYNGLEFGLLKPRRPAIEMRMELGFAETDFVLGTSAKLKEWKRIDRLLRTAARLRNTRLRVLVVGDGPDLARLTSLATSLRIERKVTFAGAQENVADYLQAMDAFCLPSMGLESFGNSAVEAMALGLPTIIFADGGGMVEHIEDGSTGFIVKDDEELIARITVLMEDPDLRAQMGTRGQASVRERYTPGRSASAYRAVYFAALRARGAR